jgi:uncharacterized protein YqfA (UPF0365 family)
MKLTLKKAVTYKGKEYMELEYDLDALTGLDLIKAKKAMGSNIASQDERTRTEAIANSIMPSLSMEYQAQVAAIACNVPYGVITALSAGDFSKITYQVSLFLAQDVG